MASAEKTSMGLNQWVGTDKPKMADFNTDNEIIDREIARRARYDLGKYSGASSTFDGIESETEAAVMFAGTIAGIGNGGSLRITSVSGVNDSTVTISLLAPLRAAPDGTADSLDVLSGMLIRRVSSVGEVLDTPSYERVQTGRVVLYAGRTTITCSEGSMEVTVLDPRPVSRALLADALPDEYLATILPESGGVASVFGRGGVVQAQTGDYRADQIVETDTRKFLTPEQIAGWDRKASSESVQTAQQMANTALDGERCPSKSWWNHDRGACCGRGTGSSKRPSQKYCD